MNSSSSIEFQGKDFFMLQNIDFKTQTCLLGRLNFFSLELHGTSQVVEFEHISGKKVLLVKGIGAVLFGDSPLFDEFYLIGGINGVIAGYGIKRGTTFEMYTIDEDYIVHPITQRIENGLNVEGDFSSFEDLVEFAKFYYSTVFNYLDV